MYQFRDDGSEYTDVNAYHDVAGYRGYAYGYAD
jgi:hypothetical protein